MGIAISWVRENMKSKEKYKNPCALSCLCEKHIVLYVHNAGRGTTREQEHGGTQSAGTAEERQKTDRMGD